MTAAPPPYLLLETRDRDQAGEHLGAAYGAPVRITGHEGCFSFRDVRMATGTLIFENIAHTGAEIDNTVESLPVLSIGLPRSVIMDFQSADTHHRFGSGDPFLLSRTENDVPFRAAASSKPPISRSPSRPRSPPQPRHFALSRSGSPTGAP
ncbi:hypothetical protein [Amycolatopsis anabasis]|uniref:hypothetical protein n=1 Tax=Amycolatopsis anabasis TaxID=1840409 RepID=UPI00131CA2CA|nr:hypothetical protein [Amycolatopsis anabasis]